MKSLHTRLEPIKDQVLRFTELFGRSRSMDEFEVRDYVCFSNWLKEVTGDENFGVAPAFSSRSCQGVLAEVAIKVVRTLFDLQAENSRLRRENEILKAALSQGNGKDTDQALALVELCRV